MPVIARFYGLIIKMFFVMSEHNPPHIHVLYGDMSAIFNIQTGSLMEGDLPPRASGMVEEWIGLYRTELLEMWKTQQFKALPPLE